MIKLRTTRYTYSYSVYFVDKFTVQFTVKYTNNVAHAHYHPCNEYVNDIHELKSDAESIVLC